MYARLCMDSTSIDKIISIILDPRELGKEQFTFNNG